MSAQSRVLDLVFAAYKRILSPILHSVGVSNCIFLPTCSEYARIALERHGLVRGTSLAMRRVARCHPWGKGGLDPVP